MTLIKYSSPAFTPAKRATMSSQLSLAPGERGTAVMEIAFDNPVKGWSQLQPAWLNLYQNKIVVLDSCLFIFLCLIRCV